MTSATALCPSCRGTIHPQAMVCPHCGAEIPASGPLLDASSTPDSVASPGVEAPSSGELPPVEPAGETGSAQPSASEKRDNSLAGAGWASEATPPPPASHKDWEAAPPAQAEASSSPTQAEPHPTAPSLLDLLRQNLATLEASMAWNEVWFFMMWGFLFLSYFIN